MVFVTQSSSTEQKCCTYPSPLSFFSPFKIYPTRFLPLSICLRRISFAFWWTTSMYKAYKQIMFFPLTPLQCLKESQAWEFNKWFWKQHALKLILCCMLSTTTVNIPSLNFICRGNALQHLLLMAAYRCEKRKLWCEKRKKKPQNLSYSGLRNPRCSPTSPFPEGIQHR